MSKASIDWQTLLQKLDKIWKNIPFFIIRFLSFIFYGCLFLLYKRKLICHVSRFNIVYHFTSLLTSLFTCYLIFIIVALLFIIQTFIYVRISHYMPKKQEKNAQIKIIYLSLSVSAWILEITIYPSLFYLSQIIYQNQQLLGIILILILMIPYFILCNVSKYSLYSKFVLILVPIQWNYQNIILHLLFITLTVYKILQKNKKYQQILYGPILALYLSSYWAQLTYQYIEINGFDIAVYLVILIPLVTMFIFYFNEKLNYKKDVQIFTRILQKTQKLSPKQRIINYFQRSQILDIFQALLGKSRIFDQIFYSKIQKKLIVQMTIKSLNDTCQDLVNKILKTKQRNIYKFFILRFMMLTGKPISKILQFVHKNDVSFNNCSEFQQKIQYFKVNEKIKVLFGSFSNNKELEVSQVQQLTQFMNKIMQNLSKLSMYQIQFWQVLKNQKIDKNQLLQKFDQLLKIRKKISTKDIQKLNLDKIHKKIYERIQKRFIQYDSIIQEDQEEKDIQQQEEDYLKDFNVEKSVQIKIKKTSSTCSYGHNKYIIISNQKIEKISTSLLEEFNLKKENVKQSQWKQFFTEELFQYLSYKINFLRACEQKQPLFLPFFKDKYQFTLSEARIIWYPSITSDLKYMIKIQTLPSQCFLFYNMDTKRIQSYSHKFIQMFEISPKIINYLIENNQLTYENLFLGRYDQTFAQHTCKINQKYTQTQKQNNFFHLKLCLKGLYQQLNQKQDDYQKVFMRCYDYIYLDNGILSILEIKLLKEYFSQSQKSLGSQSLGFIAMQSLQVQKSHAQIYQNELFFCPIANSYQSKITQKISQTNQNLRIRCFMLLILLAFLYSFLGISDSINNYQSYLDRKKQYIQISQSISIGSSLFISLYKMYIYSLKRYQIRTYPYNISKSFQISHLKLQNEYQKSQYNQIQNFANIYLNYFHRQYSNQIDYNITYKQFNVISNTQLSTLIDFSQNFRENLQMQKYQFVLQNYLSFRELTLKFQNYMDITQVLQSNFSTNKVFIFSAFLLGLFLQILFLFILCKNQANIQSILSLYQTISDEQIAKRLNILKKQHTIFFKKQQKYKQQHIKYNFQMKQKIKLQPSISISNQIPINIQNMNTNAIHFNIQAVKYVDNKIKKKQLLQEKEQKNKKRQKSFHRQIISLKMQKYSKYFFYLGIFSLYMIIFILNLMDLTSENLKIVQTLSNTKHVYNAALQLNRLNSDSYMIPIYQDKYKNKYMIFPKQQSIKIDIRFQQQSIFQSISQMKKTVQTTLQANLCDYSANHTNIQVIQCQKYFQGILTRGYSQSFVAMLDLSQKIKNNKLHEFSSQKCTQTFCPSWITFDYIYKKLSNAMDIVFQKIKSFQLSIIDQILNEKQILLIQKVSINFLGILLLIFLIYFEEKNSSRAIQMFKIYPKSIINKMRITNFLRKHNILEKLGKL